MMKKNKRIFGNELKYLKEVLETEFRSSKGAQMMNKLESSFAERFDSPFAVSFVNGTCTMHAALEAFGVQPGDEVIVPPLTMSSTSFAVLQANATPIFADVDIDTFQISYESIRDRITENTKAIITVALYGLSPDMDPIMSLAREKGIKVIEDNAECFLGEYKGAIAGTIGDVGSFSFQSSKHLTSGEGGIIVTKDQDIAEKIRKVQSLGYAGVKANKGKITKRDIQHPKYKRHETLGWNYRMPELCCAVALAQLENIDHLVKRRIESADIFSEATREFHEWFIPQKIPHDCLNSYWTWVCKIDRDDISWEEVRDLYIKNGGDGIYAAWMLTYLEPMFSELKLLGREKFISDRNLQSYRLGLCPNAEYLQPRLMQFKTNYWYLDDAKKQADILFKTLSELK